MQDFVGPSFQQVNHPGNSQVLVTQKRSQSGQKHCNWTCASISLGLIAKNGAQIVLDASRKNGDRSRVRSSSTGIPEHATISAFVETSDSNRSKDPNSPVNSQVGRPPRQIRTLQRICPFQKRRAINRFVPRSLNSMAKHCSAATCSATSAIAQLKNFWKMVWETNRYFEKKRKIDRIAIVSLMKWNLS